MSYGRVDLPIITYFFHQTSITLNRAALDAFGRAERMHRHYFSIGGALVDPPSEGAYLWDVPSGQGLFATLQFVDGKECRVGT